MSHDGSSCKSYIKHPTEKERLDNLAFTTFPEDYLPYTSSYHRKAPYLVWDDGFRPHRKRRLKRWRESSTCRCCTTAALVTAISVIVVGILSIVAVSVYLGVVTNLFRSPILSLSGKVSVIQGDEFSDHLLNTSSYQFLSKAETYQAMLENVYLSSSLESAFVGAKVYAFRKGGLLVFFRIYLDRRKLLQSDKDILIIAKNIITDEATANKRIFNNLNIDPFSVEFREYEDEQWLSVSESQFQKQTVVGGIHEENINSLFISHAHEEEYSSYTSTSVNEISQPIYTKDFRADKETELYVTPIDKGIGMLDNLVPNDHIQNVSSTERGIQPVETINIGERTHIQWQPLSPTKMPVTEVTVGLQLPHGESQNPGKGSVRLLDDVPINSHSFPVLRIPYTDKTHDLNPQSIVASSIMSSVSLVILPSSKNHTVTLSNKSGLDKNTIATVVKPDVTEVNSSLNYNDRNSNAGKLNSDASSLVNSTDEEHLGIRRDHASLRFIDHQLKDKIRGQHISGDGNFSTDINLEKNFTRSLSETTIHSLLSSGIIESDKNIKLVSSQDHDNQSLNHKYIDESIRTSDLVESYETDSVTMTNNLTLSPDYTREAPSSPEIMKDKHEIKLFHSEKENTATSQSSSEKFKSERFYDYPKSEVDYFQNITNIKLNTDSINKNVSLHLQLEISTLVEPLSGDFNLGIDENNEESHVNESSVFSRGNNSSQDLHDLSGPTVNLSSVMDELQTRHPSKLEFYPEVTTTFTNSGSLATFSLKLVKETTLKYIGSVNYDEVTTGDFTTNSYIRTEENFTRNEKLEYKDNASNISDSLMIASEQNSSIGDSLVGLPKIVPPFSDTQFNPNDINSESEIKNDDSFLDKGKFFPATPLSVLDIVALTLNPTAESPEEFTNLSDDENVVLHHITTPQPISKNDTLVASLGKHPTYLFGRCLEDEIPCHSGECVPANYRCNMRRDCRDNSDEEHCSCSERLKVIGQLQKICDGVQDCWDLSDEENCPWCSSGQFICPQSRFCVNMTQVCDGINDCPYGTDEKYCVKLAEDEIIASSSEYKSKGYLMVRKQGQWGKLCLENLSNLAQTDTLKWKIEELGRAVCTALTYKEFKEARQVEDSGKKNQSYYEISAEIVNRQNRRSNAIFHPSECQSKDVIHVTCKSLECGMRPMAFSLRQRIVGGQSTMSGSWPWQVALYKEGDFQCGAVLVSDSWLISAGHCFYSTQTSHWTARLGLLRRGTELPSPSERVRRITHIFLHPEYVDKGFINDIALLRLESPVPFSDYLRPLCLPNATEDVSLWNSQQCSVIGWGKLFEVGHTFPDSLQEVRLPVISTEECRKKILFLSMYHITDNMFCAGYERGGRDACLGDSGGPLMCQRSDGRWVLLGVTSNGDGCGRPGRPGVYTKVTKYLNWIQQTIDSELPSVQSTVCHGHRCPLGRCVPEQKVCDGRWDCSDGSDEIHCLVK